MGATGREPKPSQAAMRTSIASCVGWQLWGDELSSADVGDGSAAGLREIDLDAADLPVKQNRQTHDVRWHWASATSCRPRMAASEQSIGNSWSRDMDTFRSIDL